MSTAAAATPVTVNPFLALRSFKREDAGRFFGRDADLVLIQSRLFSSRCTLLFAASGVGKSSFLDAKLAPAVESQWQVITHRAWAIDAPLVALQASIAARLPASGGLDLVTQVERLIGAPGESRGCLVVLDQFEEVFQHWRDSKALDEFAGEVARLVHTPGLEARVLISMREEFLGELSLFDNLIPDLFNNCYRLKNATLSEAEEIITRTARLCGVDCGPGLDALLVDLVSASSRIDGARRRAPAPLAEPSPRGRIPMPFLQIVCYRLWKQQMLGVEPHRTFLESDPGPVRDQLEAYCREKLKALSAPEQDLAAAAFGFLMTRSGAKMAYPIDVLAQQAHVNEAALLAVLKRLAAEDVRILRDIPAGPNAKPWFELYHDLYSRFLSEWKRDHDAVREAALGRKSRVMIAALVILSAIVVGGLTSWWASAERQRQFADQLLPIAEGQRTTDLQETPLSVRLKVESFVRSPDRARESLRRALQSNLIETRRLELPETADLIDVSPNGQVLSYVSDAGLSLMRLPEMTPIGVVKRTSLVSAIAFSSDSARIAAAGWDGIIEIISTADAKPIVSMDILHDGVITAVSFSPDGSMIAASGNSFDDTLHVASVYRVGSTAAVTAVPEERPVSVISFSPDGRYFLTANDEGQVRLTDLLSGERTSFYHKARVGAAAFNADGSWFASASADGVVQRTKVPAGPSTQISEISASANALAFSSSGRYLATSQGVLLDLEHNQARQFETGGSITALAFTPDEQTLATATDSGLFIITTDKLEVRDAVGRGIPVRRMKLDSQGGWLAIVVGKTGKTLRWFRLQPTGQALPTNDRALEALACQVAGQVDPADLASLLKTEPPLGCRR